jgi:hypothetical protein
MVVVAFPRREIAAGGLLQRNERRAPPQWHPADAVTALVPEGSCRTGEPHAYAGIDSQPLRFGGLDDVRFAGDGVDLDLVDLECGVRQRVVG